MILYQNGKPFSCIQRILCCLYILYISYFFLFIYHDNYIDMTVTKRFYYLIGSAIFCAIMLLLMIFRFIFESSKWNYSYFYITVILIGMILLWGIGLYFASDPYESLWGNYYKCTGLLVYILGTLSIIFLGNHLHWNSIMTAFFLLSSTLLCLLQVLNRWEIDPLNIYLNLIYYEHPQYIATLGNTNYNGAFDCLIIGILMTLFFQDKGGLSLFIKGSVLCIAFAGAICTVSDVVYICIAMVFVVLTGFACATPSKWFRIWLMLVLFTIPCGFFQYFFNHREEELYIWDITGIIFHGTYFKYQFVVVLGFGVLLLLLLPLLAKYKEGLLTIYKLMIVTGIFVLFIFLVIANSSLFHYESYPLLSSLHIDGTWGNDRGDLWQRMYTLFLQAPLANKLFGYGFNMVFPALDSIGLGIRAEEEIADAHNIYFNTLITSGIIGCLFWAIFIGILLYRCCRLIQQKKDQGLYALIGLLCILVQGLVIGPQIITTPIVLTEFGVFYNLVTTHSTDEP